MKHRNTYTKFILCAYLLVLTALLPTGASAAQVMTRTLKDKPAILIAAFGTSTKAQATYDEFEKQLKATLPDYEIRWAFTSEVIRERVNAKRAKEGNPEKLLSVQQALADIEAQGYTKVVVEPLQIFPGEEYEETLRLAKNFPGLKVEFGETLLHRWEYVHEVLGILSKDFLTPEEGSNVLVAHGSPQTAVGSNSTYLGIDRYLSKKYPNVFIGCVEGILTREEALNAAKAHPTKKVRFIPFMFVGGDHIMNDIMGDDDGSGEPSWKGEISRAGKLADIPTVTLNGETLYRGLGLIPEINKIYIREIERALNRL